MSRTAHHISTTRTGSVTRSRRAWRAVSLVDLRFSEDCLRAAVVEGRRPRPRLVRREVEVFSYPRSASRDREVSRIARLDERRARQALRRELGVVRRHANRVTNGQPHRETTTDMDIAPVRHRHNAAWQAW